MSGVARLPLADAAASAFDRRRHLVEAVAGQTDAIADACEAMADRFRRGGRLLAFGNGTAACDASHVAVEFAHPVTVGKRALPSVAISNRGTGDDPAAAPPVPDDAHGRRLVQLARPGDIALGISNDGRSTAVWRGLETAAQRGLLTVALTGEADREAATTVAVDHRLVVPSPDPLIIREGHVTLYHLLWELVHVFLDHSLESAPGAPNDDGDETAGVEGLYPFLYEGASERESVLDEVRRSVRGKAADAGQVRAAVAATMTGALGETARALASAFSSGATMFTFGNGGSSTDAQAMASQFALPANVSRGDPLPALCLTDDVALVTALANDVGFDLVFSRQLASLARSGDLAVGLSTSGDSPNVVRALEEAHRGGLTTVGIAGGGGGAMAESSAVDHVFVVPSASIHRIQEAQTTIYHVLWELTHAALNG